MSIIIEKKENKKNQAYFLRIVNIHDSNSENKSHVEEKRGYIVTLTFKCAGGIGYYTELTYCQ